MEAIVSNIPVARVRGLTISKLAFFFWFIYQINFSIIYLFFQRNPGYGTMLEHSFVLCSLFFLLLLVLNKTIVIKKGMFIGSSLIFVLVTWAGFTLFWTPDLNSALLYWIRSLSEVIVVFILFRTADSQKVAISSLKGIFYGSFALAVIMVSTIGNATGQLGHPVFFHYNVIGNQLAIASICGIYLYFSKNVKRKGWFLLTLLFVVSVLLLSFSKTALIAFGLSFVVYFLKTKLGSVKKTFLILLTGSVLAVFYNRLEEQWLMYSSLGNGRILTTFSGRTIIWDLVWTKIQDHPILGYGFFSFQSNGPQPFRDTTIGSAHNEFLNIWFNFGFIGLVTAILIYLVFIRRIIVVNKIYKNKQAISHATLSLAILVYFLIRGLTEGHPTLLVFNIPLLLLLMEWLYVKPKN